MGLSRKYASYLPEKVVTTPQNVKESNFGLYHATMNSRCCCPLWYDREGDEDGISGVSQIPPDVLY